MNYTTHTGRRFALRSLPLAAVAAAALLVGTAPDAKAGAIAYSNLHVTNFTISDSGGTQYDASDFSALNVGNTSAANASINGAGSSTSDVGPGNRDAAMVCLGAACGGIGQNDFSQQVGTFSRGDSQLSGAIITGLGVPSSADAQSVADLNISDGNAASGGTVGTTTEFTFALGSADSITFEFDATPQLQAALSGGTGQAQADVAFSIAIADANGTTLFSWAPDGVLGGTFGGTENSDPNSLNIGRGTLSDGTVAYNPGTGTYSATTGVLAAGQNYKLTINHQSTASGRFQATEVPEPATLMMLGAGLLGLGAFGHRRRKAA